MQMFKTEIDSLCADFDNTLNRHSKLKERTPKLFFNSGFPANFCFFATFIFALFFFSSYFDELQMDSEVIIFDLHIVYPSAILKLLPLVSSKGGWISVIGLSMHCYAMYTTKARVILPDLLNIGAWIFMTGCHFVSRNVPDIYLIRFIVAGILCITTASVTFLPRKRKHRKRPNTVLSAFSVASTPISQCTTLDSESLLSSECTSPELSVRRSPKSVIASGMQRQHRFRNRGVTSTAKLSRNLGGHQSMEQGADNETENRRESFSLFSTNTSTTRRRSPISVVKKGILPESELQDEDVCTQEIDGIFGGLKLGSEDEVGSAIKKRRGPFSSISYNSSVRNGHWMNPPVCGASVYTPSEAPSKIRSLRAPQSVFTSVSQQNSQWSGSTPMFITAAVVISVFTNLAMFAYMYYDRQR